jgi:hypothetical protein
MLTFLGPERHRRDDQAAHGTADQGRPSEEGIRRCRHRHPEHQWPSQQPEAHARWGMLCGTLIMQKEDNYITPTPPKCLLLMTNF